MSTSGTIHHSITPEQGLALVLDVANQGVLAHDGQTVLFANERLHELLDLPAGMLVPGAPIEDFVQFGVRRGDYGLDMPPSLQEQMALLRSRNITTERCVPGGRIVRTDACFKDGYAVVTYTDVTEAFRREEELRQSRARERVLAEKDGLTNLLNRRTFDRRLSEHVVGSAKARQRLGQLRRENERRGCQQALLLIDLDRFKAVNDGYGHAVGDALLKELARRFLAIVSEGDVLARVGGDEFAVLAVRPSKQEIITLGERLRSAAATPVLLDKGSPCCGASIGIAYDDGTITSVDELMHAADLALYAAKAKGRNAVLTFHAQMNRDSQARAKLEHELRQSLTGRQMVLHYQPQRRLGTSETVGYEALMRWRHPERGLVAPGDFIPLAEETGYIVELGRWALYRAACDFADRDEALRVSVNVSPVQFAKSDLVADVSEALEASGLPASRLEIELTEKVLIDDAEATLQTLTTLEAMGVTLSLDDFGSGYSSLSYLTRFPFSKIKIDRSFVHRMLDDDRSSALVGSILSLAAALDLRVTAEGVEHLGQLSALTDARCDEAQGFLLGRPQPIETLFARPQAGRSAQQELRPTG